ncbi:MAG: hypothetical protein JWM11_7724 [Planctomycetaceae bacterium]|nr:hypothetical protein [Planctomycetaceae bacterium]
MVSAFGLRGGYVKYMIWGSLLGAATYWFLRRKCRRRLAVMQQPFSAAREAILRSRVGFYQALDEPGKARFRSLVQVFLDEIQITGVRTEVDEAIRVLVAASAIIPVFGFHDWEYHRLSEVLVYPTSFNQEYKTEGTEDRNILGLAGFGHLSGVMILSKPALLAGFSGSSDKENVGIHEFAHLIEQEEVSHGLPAEVPLDIMREWAGYVGRELSHPKSNQAHMNEYGYTNDHEFFAVLTEYFFKSPEILQQRDPVLYNMLRKMFHQDPASLMSHLRPRGRISRNSKCPCGSGKKFKECCQPHLTTS